MIEPTSQSPIPGQPDKATIARVTSTSEPRRVAMQRLLMAAAGPTGLLGLNGAEAAGAPLRKTNTTPKKQVDAKKPQENRTKAKAAPAAKRAVRGPAGPAGDIGAPGPADGVGPQGLQGPAGVDGQEGQKAPLGRKAQRARRVPLATTERRSRSDCKVPPATPARPARPVAPARPDQPPRRPLARSSRS